MEQPDGRTIALKNKTKCLQKKYVGKWIAILNDEVVAEAKKHQDIYKLLETKNINGVRILYCPSPDEQEVALLL